MKVVLDVVLPILVRVIRAKYCMLAVRQKWRFEIICVGHVNMHVPVASRVGIWRRVDS